MNNQPIIDSPLSFFQQCIAYDAAVKGRYLKYLLSSVYGRRYTFADADRWLIENWDWVSKMQLSVSRCRSVKLLSFDDTGIYHQLPDPTFHTASLLDLVKIAVN